MSTTHQNEKLVCIKKPATWSGRFGVNQGPSTMEVCTVKRTHEEEWLVLQGYPEHLLYHRHFFRQTDNLDKQLGNIEAMASLEYGS